MVKALAHESIYDTVLGIVKDRPRGTILDIPAGEGALAERLAGIGFDVRCCDLYPEIFKLEGVEIRQGDLSGVLPYEDASFDDIVCVEGLEHIENPHQAIREFARLIKPGGSVIVSVPNIMNIEERLKWLFFGYTSHFKPLSREALAKIDSEYAGREEVALHINPIPYSELRYLLENNGFQLMGTHVDKPKKNSWAFAPIVLLVRLVNRFVSAAKRRERWSEELGSGPVLLGGNTLILHAVKQSE